MDRSSQIDTFNRITQVSRETISSLEKYEYLLINANKNLNLIGKSTINQMWKRHFLDSYQVIDFIDKNDKLIVDIGSGAGFPGLVLAIIAKEKKIPLKIKLIEKSPKKANFLREVNKELGLGVMISNVNVFENQVALNEEVFVARAFKPLKIILELMHKKAKNLKKIFVFLGKTSERELLEASKSWDIKYKQSMSITSNDSIIVEINSIQDR